MIGVTFNPIDVHITKAANREIKYLVIHYTAGSSSTDGAAEKTRKVFLSREASADFIVDDDTMVQVNPDPRNFYCWAVGDGKGKNGIWNKDCISIEICSTLKKGASFAKPNHSGWSFTDAALNNAVQLARSLMVIYNIPIDHVIRHFDATGKSCPGIVGWNKGVLYDESGTKQIGINNEAEWLKFKERLA